MASKPAAQTAVISNPLPLRAVSAFEESKGRDRIQLPPITEQPAKPKENFHTRVSVVNPKCSCYFSVIPDDIFLFHVFSFLDVKSRVQLYPVCKRWYKMLKHEYIWSDVDLSGSIECVNDAVAYKLLHPFRKTIKSLKLCGCHKTTAKGLIKLLPETSNLEVLHLCALNAIDDDVLAETIPKTGALEELSLYKCHDVSDEGLALIGRSLPNLRIINLYENTNITNEGVEKLPASLESLNIGGCTRINPATLFDGLQKRCPDLSTFNLHGLVMSDDDVEVLCDSFPMVEEVILSSSNPFGGTSRLTDKALSVFSSSATFLRSLNISGSNLVTNDGVKSFAESVNAKFMRKLNLGGCFRLEDDGLIRIARTLTELTSLVVAQCIRLTDRSIKVVVDEMTKLSHLDFHTCVRVTDDALKGLVRPVFDICEGKRSQAAPSSSDDLSDSGSSPSAQNKPSDLMTDPDPLARQGMPRHRTGKPATQLSKSQSCGSIASSFPRLNTLECKLEMAEKTQQNTRLGYTALHKIDLSSCMGISDEFIYQLLCLRPYIEYVQFRKLPPRMSPCSYFALLREKERERAMALRKLQLSRSDSQPVVCPLSPAHRYETQCEALSDDELSQCELSQCELSQCELSSLSGGELTPLSSYRAEPDSDHSHSDHSHSGHSQSDLVIGLKRSKSSEDMEMLFERTIQSLEPESSSGSDQKLDDEL